MYKNPILVGRFSRDPGVLKFSSRSCELPSMTLDTEDTIMEVRELLLVWNSYAGEEYTGNK